VKAAIPFPVQDFCG